MATKAELEQQIDDLRRKVDMLEAQLLIVRQQRPITILPRPSDTPWPWPYQPYWAVPPVYPHQVWCGSGTSPGIRGTTSFNASAA